MAPGTLRPLTVKAASVAAVTYAGPLFLAACGGVRRLGGEVARGRSPRRRGQGPRDHNEKITCGPTDPVFRCCSTTQRHAQLAGRPRAMPRHGSFVRLERPKTWLVSDSFVTCLTSRERSRVGHDLAVRTGRPRTPVTRADRSGRSASIEVTPGVTRGAVGGRAGPASSPISCTARRWIGSDMCPTPRMRTLRASRSGWSTRAARLGTIIWSRSLHTARNRVRQPGRRLGAARRRGRCRGAAGGPAGAARGTPAGCRACGVPSVTRVCTRASPPSRCT